MARIGETPCWNPRCGCTDAPVYRTSGGRLAIKCHKCGAEPWLPLGTKAHRDGTELTKMDEGQPTPTPPTSSPPAAPPASRRMTLLG